MSDVSQILSEMVLLNTNISKACSDLTEQHSVIDIAFVCNKSTYFQFINLMTNLSKRAEYLLYVSHCCNYYQDQ